MSKTKGNVIDPLQVMDRYGTDALRFALATGGTPGNDMRLSLNRVESARNFANKLWNAAAYVVDRAGTGPVESPEPASLGRADAWILARYNRLVADVNRLFADYQFGEAGRHLYEFLYADFCDEYLEQSKVLLQRDAAAAEATRRTLRFVLEGTLRLLHPTMPFVTEAIWQHLTGGRGVGPAGEAVNALIVCAFPQPDARWANPEAEADLGIVNELARAIRAARAELGVDAARRVPLVVEAGERASLLEAERDILVWRARLDPEAVTIVPRLEAVPPQAVALPTGHGVTGYLPLAGLFDVEAERRRLQAEAEHERRGVEKSRALLANQAYLAKAPAAVVEKERARLVEAEARLSAIEERLRRLG